MNLRLGATAAALRWSAGAHAALTDPALSILIFHRVLARPDPLFPGETDAARFDALMGLVARSFRVVTVGQALAELARGRVVPRSLAITFDDGYADNADVALPILQRHGLRATFFVATGFLDGGRMFNDSVIEAVRASPRDELDLGEFGLGCLGLRSPAERRAVIDALIPKVKVLPLREREHALQRLWRACGEPALPQALMMRSAQVQQLHAAGMEIGGHTANHPILARCPNDEARREIESGRDALQRLIDAPIEVFAYPNGRPDSDYDERHVRMVRELGFRGAVSTARGAARVAADPFQLPRHTPWGRSLARWSAEFLANLNQRAFATAGAAQPAGSR